MTQAPRVSVILPVYNGEEFLHDSVESILNQSFDDLELIVINDGSSDGTATILDAIQDPRLRVVHQANQGLALSLNKGIALARGEYIARQDADDVSLPDRLAKQVAYLDTHPEYALLGTWSYIQVGDVLTKRQHQHPTTNGELQIRLLFDSYFVHSSVMMRKEVVISAGLYATDPERNPPEDFDLWLRISRHHRIGNLSTPLLIYREVPGSISRSKAELLSRRAIKIAVENLMSLVGDDVKYHVLADLVVIMRHSFHCASAKPDWRGLANALKIIEDRLTARWPDDAPEIRRGGADLGAQLRRARLKCNMLVRSALAVREALRARL